ncbi:hypothetical protein NUW58_g9818 [Xylaria curta]|uniref:Uncharacterized protein n=1 Tax=Xylaria curta TaxID=42375 RepID=A0ACC1MTP9_9PEZI|nr:hypothetical protein NUW58_g9818 [Xylaria curta]
MPPPTASSSASAPGAILLPAPIHESETVSFGISAPTTSTTVALALGDALAVVVSQELHTSVSSVFARNHPGGAIGASFSKPRTMRELAVPVAEIASLTGSIADLSGADVLKAGYESSHVADGAKLTDIPELMVPRSEWLSIGADTRISQAARWIRDPLMAPDYGEAVCGEDWYHPGCLVGQGPKWYEKLPAQGRPKPDDSRTALASVPEDPAPEIDGEREPNDPGLEDGDEDVPLPEGFPQEGDFDLLLCFKCVEAYPWIKRYAGTPGFLPPVLREPDESPRGPVTVKKRKLEDDNTDHTESEPKRRVKSDPHDEDDGNLTRLDASNDVPMKLKEEDTKDMALPDAQQCKLTLLPPTPNGVFSLFLKADFRDHICHCPSCFPQLKPHPQLLEQEEEYEPPLSDASGNESTHGSGSLYERGESALKNVDRVRAIEGVMAYNNLKEKLKPFFQQFAESGKAIGAEDIKEYFAKLRGDDQAIRDAGEAAKEDHRREQSGY